MLETDQPVRLESEFGGGCLRLNLVIGVREFDLTMRVGDVI